MPMKRSRSGGVDATPTRHPGSPRHVSVLEVGEEGLVETAYVFEHARRYRANAPLAPKTSSS